MKRKLALLLALVMILSLVPMSAFAASSNRVDRVVTVDDGDKFDVVATAPKLIIAEDKDDFTTEVFQLRLINGEWLETIPNPAFVEATAAAAAANAAATAADAALVSANAVNTLADAETPAILVTEADALLAAATTAATGAATGANATAADNAAAALVAAAAAAPAPAPILAAANNAKAATAAALTAANAAANAAAAAASPPTLTLAQAFAGVVQTPETATVAITRESDTMIEVTITETINTTDDDSFTLPMLVDVGDAGEVRVEIDSRGSQITSGTYTFAVSADGATIISVGDAETVRRGPNQVAKSFIIDETALRAIGTGNQRFELKLPSDVNWDVDSVGGRTTVTLPTDAFGTGILAISYIKGDTDRDGIEDANETSFDAEILVVEFDPTAAGTRRRMITVNPVLDIQRDAELGEIKVDLRNREGDISSKDDILIAEYKDFDIEVSIDDVEEFIAGRVDTDYETDEIVIEEAIANSIARGRLVEFTLPEWVQITAGEGVVFKVNGTNNTVLTGNATKDTSEFEVELSALNGYRTDGRTNEIKIVLPLTVEANKAGDIELVIDGANIDEEKIVVGKAIAPISVEVKVADVKIGMQDQPAPEIIITENVAGALIENGMLDLVLADTRFDITFDDAEVEVIAGDLKIDADDSGVNGPDNGIEIKIDRDSSEKSKIKVSGIKLTLDRSVPEGIFKLNVQGTALVQNGLYNDDDFSNRVAQFNFANIVTPASGELRTTSKFVIGSTTYKVLQGGVEVAKTMDVAPFIEGGRTFIPIRFAAETVGVSADNVIWNAEAKTVTILKGDRVIGLTIGSNVLTVNGTPIVMDTAAMIKDGRTVLPVRFVAQALGAAVTWDEATQTVTVTQ